MAFSGLMIRRTGGRIRMALRVAGLALVLLVGGGGLYACAARRAIEREVANTPRDAVTGIVTGAEAISLDPPAGLPAPTRAVLMLHGFVGSRGDFADLGERLAAAGLYVRMVRHPGHGSDPREFAEQTADTLLEAARAELAALVEQYDEVAVVGFSMGGAMATLLAAEGDVERLVLAAPYYRVTHKWYYGLPVESWNAALGWGVPYVIKSKAFIKVNRPEARPLIYSYRLVSTRGTAALIDLGRRARQPEVAAAVRCPVLLIHSDGDEASCPRRARAVFATLASADKRELWLDRRNNHHIFWDYDCEQSKAGVVEFLSEEW